jgi:acetyl-CoA carboxylase biotin carboxyl carrier protein
VELRQIKELMAAMGRCEVTKVVLKKEGEFELQLERQEGSGSKTGQPIYRIEESAFANPLPVSRPQEPLFTPSQISTPVSQSQPAEETGKFVTSPMVGSFYTSPSPDDPAFIKVGDKVEAHTVVCIVEAMKVMNEVKSGISGTVTEILLTNGSPVEFGTKLFRIS